MSYYTTNSSTCLIYTVGCFFDWSISKYINFFTQNRLNVLKYWSDIISDYASGKISETSILPYQFLHRTASACYNSSNAYVIYQLFWDNSTKESLKIFEEELRKYINIIKPNRKLKYVLHKIEVTKIAELDYKNVFQQMKSKPIYEFVQEEIELT